MAHHNRLCHSLRWEGMGGEQLAVRDTRELRERREGSAGWQFDVRSSENFKLRVSHVSPVMPVLPAMVVPCPHR